MKYKIVLAIIFIIGFFLRFYQADANPPSLYWDEVSIGYEAFNIASTGKDMHGSSWLQAIVPAYGDYKAPAYIWLTAMFIKVLGISFLSIRLTSIIFGSLSILGIYALSAQIFSKKIGLYSAIALAFLPGHIQFSRVGFEANVGLFFIIMFLIFLHKGIKKSFYFPISAISAVVATYSYFSARIVIPFIFGFFIVAYFKNLKKRVPILLLSLVIFLVGLIPLYRSPHYQAANELRLSTDSILKNHDEIVYANVLREVDENSIISRIMHHRLLYTGKELLINMSNHLESNYLFFSGDPNPRHSTGSVGIMLPTMMGFFLLGAWSLIRSPQKFIYIFGLWTVFLLPASVPQDTPHALRSLNAIIPISMILALGFDTIIKSSKKNFIKKILTAFYLVVVVINFGVYFSDLQINYPARANSSWQDGYLQLGSYIQSQYENYNYFVVTPGDRLYLYTLLLMPYSPEKIQIQQIEALARQSNRFAPSSFGKIRFMPIVWEDLQTAASSTLAIGYPGSFPPGVEIKDEIKDINGEIVFISVDIGDYQNE